MASLPAAARARRLDADRVLGWLCVAMLATVLAALIGGSAYWSRIPVLVWAHLATIGVALALTPVMLTRAKGDRWHRRLGYVWVAALMSTAALSFGIQGEGHLRPIHLISVFVLLNVPRSVWLARRHKIMAHRRAMRGTVIGALLIAGFFTFQSGRLLERMLFG